MPGFLVALDIWSLLYVFLFLFVKRCQFCYTVLVFQTYFFLKTNMRHPQFSPYSYSENRKIFKRAEQPNRGNKGMEFSTESAEPKGDTISEGAQKIIDSSDGKIQVNGRRITLPLNNINLDGEGGGGTKRVEIISRNGNLVVNCHNNDGTIDCATISGEGDLVKFEEGVNVPIDRREQKESPGTEGSKANAPHVVADALRASEEFLGKDRNWTFPADGKLFEKALPSLKAQLPEIAAVLESKAQQGGLNEA